MDARNFGLTVAACVALFVALPVAADEPDWKAGGAASTQAGSDV
jgi:hypothetical protein